MKMLTFGTEKKIITDKKTGRKITQLTSNNEYNDYILYFTDNSFTDDGKTIIFMSDRGRNGVFNLFKMDLDTGAMQQLTDELQSVEATKTGSGDIIVYKTGNTVKKLETATGKISVIYEERENCSIRSLSVSCDKKYVGFIRNENVNVASGANYAGFGESLYAIKRAWITIAYLDGSKAFDIYESSEWLAHFQFSPDDPVLAMFCHEGPWHLIRQRIWLFDLVKRSAVPCFRQREGDCVGHEFWTQDAQIFFDNRLQGHDGTITSDKTSAVLNVHDSSKIPYIGFADKSGNVVRTVELPFHCNHYFTNNDNTLIVGDAVEDLLLIDISGEKAEMKVLCSHNTSWKWQRTHCHPTFSRAGDKILYVSDCEGSTNIYLIENIK